MARLNQRHSNGFLPVRESGLEAKKIVLLLKSKCYWYCTYLYLQYRGVPWEASIEENNTLYIYICIQYTVYMYAHTVVQFQQTRRLISVFRSDATFFICVSSNGTTLTDLSRTIHSAARSPCSRRSSKKQRFSGEEQWSPWLLGKDHVLTGWHRWQSQSVMLQFLLFL